MPHEVVERGNRELCACAQSVAPHEHYVFLPYHPSRHMLIHVLDPKPMRGALLCEFRSR